MSNLYDDFEKRFTNAHFSAGWVEVEVKPQKSAVLHKDLTALEAELSEINEQIETISQKQLRLGNLMKFYTD